MILLSALLLVGALVVGRRTLWVGLGGVVGLLAVLAVRLWGIPALSRHRYDGHEADHLAWFMGEATPGSVDTLHYPLMQQWWSMWGALLPADERLPVLISALVASAGAAALAGGIGLLAGRQAGFVALLIIGLHPGHAAWSSSAYNIALPNALAGFALLGVAAGLRLPEAIWPRVLVASALALAISGRLELLVVALVCGLLALSEKGRLRWVPVLLGGGLLAAPSLWGVLAAGPLPGAEERWQSLAINIAILDFHAPYHTPLGLLLLGVGLAAALRRWPVKTAAFSSILVVNHLLMSSFDDYGVRHTLPSLVGICWVLGAGAAALPRAGAVLLVLGALGLTGPALRDQRVRYYAEEEVFADVLMQPPWGDLPRLDAPPSVDCGWVAEDPRVAGDPARSHFNLLSAQEAESLRGESGCLRWCLDIQDWRWSSRGVRNRAIRLAHLYEVRAEAVVLERTSGYACLVMRIGERTADASPLVEWHGRGHPADTRIP